MAINISTLFADIIDTPEQRQEKLLQQGMAQGQLLASGLTGRSKALAPLAQMAGQLGVQRNEDIRRAVQPMFGIDPRTDSEKMAEKIGQMDASTPGGLLQAAQALQSVDPVRAAALRQAASELTVELSDKERTFRRQDTADRLQKEAADRAASGEVRQIDAAAERVTRFNEWQDSNATQQALQVLNLENAETSAAAEKTLREGKVKLEKQLAATYDQNIPKEKMLHDAVLSGMFTAAKLETLISGDPNDLRYTTARFMNIKTGKMENYNIVIDPNNNNAVTKLNLSSSQPPIGSTFKPTRMPNASSVALKQTIRKNPMLNAFTTNTALFAKDKAITIDSLANLIDFISQEQSISQQAAIKIVEGMNREDVAAGVYMPNTLDQQNETPNLIYDPETKTLVSPKES
jgi:hypothetical protein|tara:strand:+ start:182 stop:1393 length:1212 start_codon:yes stop_codon:yes gene_type:complete